MADEQQHHNLDTWPDVLRTLAGLIGPEATLHLADKLGGLRDTYIPKDGDRPHPWREVIGDEAWRRIVGHYGGQRVHLSRGARINLKKKEVLELSDQGMSWTQIAMKLRVTERYVRRILQSIGKANPGARKPREDPRQRNLF